VYVNTGNLLELDKKCHGSPGTTPAPPIRARRCEEEGDEEEGEGWKKSL